MFRVLVILFLDVHLEMFNVLLQHIFQRRHVTERLR